MPTEKHGGLWEDGSPSTGWALVFEHYEPSLELIGAVFQKASLFKAVLYEKGKDPQWRLPWWSERRPEALFGNHEEAVSHVHALFANAGKQA